MQRSYAAELNHSSGIVDIVEIFFFFVKELQYSSPIFCGAELYYLLVDGKGRIVGAAATSTELCLFGTERQDNIGAYYPLARIAVKVVGMMMTLVLMLLLLLQQEWGYALQFCQADKGQ
jgi:hypothetical protein